MQIQKSPGCKFAELTDRNEYDYGVFLSKLQVAVGNVGGLAEAASDFSH